MVSWTISTITAGGSAFILVPAVTYTVGASFVAPVSTITGLLGDPVRMAVFWKDIDWAIVRWYLPAAVIGAVLGGWAFAHTKIEELQLLIALFLISTLWQYRLGKRERGFKMPLWGFLPLALVVSFLSALIGATGPIQNPFYLNYGAIKERMIGTKAVNSFVLQCTKLSTYTALGAMHSNAIFYGIAAGLGSMAASWIGKKWLERISDVRFRQLVVLFVAASGVAMLWQQRGTIAHLFRLIGG